MARKILEFVLTNNKYRKNAYQKEKQKADRLLAELQGKTQNNTQNPSSGKGTPTLPIVICLGIILIIGMLIWHHKKIKMRRRRR